MTISLGLPHYVPLVALSVLLAALGGYVGLGLARQAREAWGPHRRSLLAGSAWALALGIWTMHFVGIIAAEFPGTIEFSVWLTLLSFLICILVVGISAFFESLAISPLTSLVAAVFMGGGIVSMHYTGMHAIAGPFEMHHDPLHAAAATALAILASYAALRLVDVRLSAHALAFASAIFGIAVSGMHYTAMTGMSLAPGHAEHMSMGPTISGDTLTIAVTVLAFLISGFFLLYLVPVSGYQTAPEAAIADGPSSALPFHLDESGKTAGSGTRPTMIPVETEGATRLLPAGSICAVQATTHYTLVYDGQREYFSPWSISEAEQRLAGHAFMRVHRSHLVALDKVNALRRAGDGAAVEVGQPTPRVVPVSRGHYAELKARLGLRNRMRGHIATR